MATSVCFCGVPCGNCSKHYKCGAKLDYKALAAMLKECKNKVERREKLEQQALGCKLFVKKEDYALLDRRLFTVNPRHFPKCHGHKLFAKVGVSHSANNANRTYFTCNAMYPDIECGFFTWCDDFFEPPPPPPQEQQQPPQPIYLPSQPLQQPQQQPSQPTYLPSQPLQQQQQPQQQPQPSQPPQWYQPPPPPASFVPPPLPPPPQEKLPTAFVPPPQLQPPEKRVCTGVMTEYDAWGPSPTWKFG